MLTDHEIKKLRTLAEGPIDRAVTEWALAKFRQGTIALLAEREAMAEALERLIAAWMKLYGLGE